jgi:hypothetical protein
MSDNEIQFEDEYGDSNFHIRSRKILGEPTTPTMVSFLLEKGIVKTEKQATIILVISIILFLSISIFIIRSSIVNNEELIVVNKFGQQIPFDSYIESLSKGDDPLR